MRKVKLNPDTWQKLYPNTPIEFNLFYVISETYTHGFIKLDNPFDKVICRNADKSGAQIPSRESELIEIQ